METRGARFGDQDAYGHVMTIGEVWEAQAKQGHTLAVFTPQEWRLVLGRAYASAHGKLILDKPIGEASHHVDFRNMGNVDLMWPSEEIMQEFRHNWTVFLAYECSITNVGLKSRVLYKNLRMLSLSRCALLSDEALQSIAKICPELRALEVDGCPLLSDAGVIEISQGCRELSYINLDACINVTDQGLSQIIEHCTKLRYANFAHNVRFHGSAFLTLPNAQHDVVLLVHQHLRSLDLSYCSCVADEALRWIAESLLSLEDLCLSGCTSLTDVGVGSLPLAQKLQKLNLNGCHRLTNACAFTLISMPKLNDLSVSNIGALTPQFVSILLNGCKGLARLEMLENENFGFPTVQRVLLEALEVSHTSCMGTASLQRIGQLAFLRSITFRHCSKITNAMLYDLLLARKTTLKAVDIAYCTELQGTEWYCGSGLTLYSLDCSGLAGIETEQLSSIVTDSKLRTLRANDLQNVDLELLIKRFPYLDIQISNTSQRSIRSYGNELVRRLSLEMESAIKIQKLWRRYLSSRNVTLQYLLIRHRRSVANAAIGMQKVWRQHRVMNHRLVVENIIKFQRLVRRRQWRMNFDKHIRTFQIRWEAACKIQALYRGWKWRKVHADLVLSLAVKKEQRFMHHVTQSAAVKARVLAVSQSAVVQVAQSVPTKGQRKNPLEELAFVLTPAREVLHLRRQLLIELEYVLHQRMLDQEKLHQEMYRLRRSQYGLNVRILQKWAREKVFPALERRERAIARHRRSKAERKYFGGVSTIREGIAIRGVVKLQARFRGNLHRARPYALVRARASGVPKLIWSVSHLFKKQQSEMDQITVFNSMLRKCETHQRHYADMNTATAKAKHRFYGTFGASLRLRLIISERFQGNYVKRLRYHTRTAEMVKKEMKRLQAVDHSLTLLEEYFTERSNEIKQGQSNYDSIDDTKIRILFAQTPANEVAKLAEEISLIEKKWIKDSMAEVETTRATCMKLLRAFALQETMRLETELVAQADLMRQHRELDAAFHREWAWRRELLSTDLSNVQANDLETKRFLNKQSERLENLLDIAEEQNENMTETFVLQCEHQRMLCEFPDRSTIRRLERNTMRVRREVKYRAWTAIIPVHRLKPAELVAIQEQMIEARNRVENDDAHRKAVEEAEEKANMGEENESDEEKHMNESELFIRELMEESLLTTKSLPDLEERNSSANTFADKLDNVREMFMTERDREKRRMKSTIIGRQRATLGLVDCIAALRITVGESEELAMRLVNGKLREQGLNKWRCIRKDMRTGFQLEEPVYLWVRTSTEPRYHIRHIEVDCEVDSMTAVRQKEMHMLAEESDEDDSSEDSSNASSVEDDENGLVLDDGIGGLPGNQRRRTSLFSTAKRRMSAFANETANGARDKLAEARARISELRHRTIEMHESVGHERIKTFQLHLSRMGLVNESIMDLRISSTEADAETLMRRGYTCIDAELGVPLKKRERVRPIFKLWYATTDSYKPPPASDLQKLEARRAEFEEMFAQNPNNKRVEQILREINQDIQEIEFNNQGDNSEEMKLQKLQETIDSVGLSKKDTRKLMSCFAAMDTEHIGEVALEQFLYYVGVDDSALARRIFSFLDVSGDGKLDFQELLHAVSTLCMFGPNELVKLMFNFADVEGRGTLTYEELKRVMVLQHQVDPEDDVYLKRSLEHVARVYGKEMAMSFAQLYDVHIKYPMIFQPAFELRIAMCKAFLGESFWHRKKALFEEVRREVREQTERDKNKLKREKIKELRREKGVRTVGERLQSRVFDAIDRFDFTLPELPK